jgi:hypothetical protein
MRCPPQLCPTTQCTSCWCPRDQLHDTDQVFPFRDIQSIRVELETQSEIVPKGRASSVVLGTVRGAHHSRHGSPLNPGVATTRSHLERQEQGCSSNHVQRGGGQSLSAPCRQSSGCGGRHLNDDYFARECCALGGVSQENRQCKFIAKFTGDRVRIPMLTLPFVVRDLISLEVTRYSMYITCKYCALHCIYQVY